MPRFDITDPEQYAAACRLSESMLFAYAVEETEAALNAYAPARSLTEDERVLVRDISAMSLVKRAMRHEYNERDAVHAVACETDSTLARRTA